MFEHLEPDEKEIAEIAEAFEKGEKQYKNEEISDEELSLDGIKKSMRKVLIITEKSISKAKEFADVSDDPKTYSSLAQMINAFSSLASKILDSEKEKKLPTTPAIVPTDEENKTNNLTVNVFQGNRESLMETIDSVIVEVDEELPI